MIRYRPFRNGDPPALAGLWNRGVRGRDVAGPLSPHEFDTLVIGTLGFEPEGLVVAERDDGRVVGFAHAGFGPRQPDGPSQQLNLELGTVAMLVVEPDQDDPALEAGLLGAAEDYLRSRRASVIYAGGRYPLNPFYWGVYGGSEFAGILGSHATFHRAVARAGYEPTAASVLLELDLAGPEIRNPKSPWLRRQTWIEVIDDALLPRWWDELALGMFRPMVFRLLNRADGRQLAWAAIWDMHLFTREASRPRIGLFALEVAPPHRRQGFGRHLVSELIRTLREQWVGVVSVQTDATNTAALALYQSLGFARVETATMYRRPG